MNPIGAQAFTRGAKTPAGTRAARGFTLIELMITIAIAAILLMIAIPAFDGVIARTNQGAISNDLLTSLKYARSEAVGRAEEVVIKPTSADWADGWNVQTQDDKVLREYPSIKANFNLTAVDGDGAAVAQVTYEGRGILQEPDGGACFTLKAPADAQAEPIHIVLWPSGSISQFKGNSVASTPCA